MAEPEKCYFECFIRKHPLLYKSVTSVASDLHLVSLRECHLVLFLDNLVRLQKRSDPDRGSSHTIQISTLPITMKGLPKDNKVTLDWHLEECEGDPKCCKDRIVLNKNDVERCIFSLSEEETAMQTLLTQHIFWDLCTVIKASSILHDLLNDASERSTIAITSNEISSMENSFKDLSITEDPIYSATKGVDQSCSDEEHAKLDDLETYFDDSHELSDIFAQGLTQLSTIKEDSSPPYRVSLFSTSTTDDDIDEQEAEELLNECALILKSIPLTNTSSFSQTSRPCKIMSHTSTMQPEEDWTFHGDHSLLRQSSISTISCLNLSEDQDISTEGSETCDPDHSLYEVT
ncbi:hypothetical protein ACJMK2_011307 [Sinanodonta woodiana]|uniref:Uncharacterized protein n=1 Tax=Sinanodonta woodiana TaxID=1069815 RepID=A0ABD3V4R5_SINWO